MRARLSVFHVAIAVLLGGCNAVFGLDAVEVGGQGGGASTASSSASSGGSSSVSSGGSTTVSSGGGGSGAGGSGAGGSGAGGGPACPAPFSGALQGGELTSFEAAPGGSGEMNCDEGAGGGPDLLCSFGGGGRVGGAEHLRASLPIKLQAGQCIEASLTTTVTAGQPTARLFASDGIGLHFIEGESAEVLGGTATWACSIPYDVALDTFGFQIVGDPGDTFEVTDPLIRLISDGSCDGGLPPCGFAPGCGDPTWVDFEGEIPEWTSFPDEGEPGAPDIEPVAGFAGCDATRFVLEPGETLNLTASSGIPLPAEGACIEPRMFARGTDHVSLILHNLEGTQLTVRFLDLEDRWVSRSAAIGAEGASSCTIPDGYIPDLVALSTGEEGTCRYVDVDRFDWGEGCASATPCELP